MLLRRLSRPATLLLALATLVSASAADFTVAADHADGIYKVGEPVTWTITAAAAPSAPLNYSVKSGGLTEISKGALAFTGATTGATAKVTASLDKPGTLLLDVQTGGKTPPRGGAAIGWEGIAPSADEPADFDAFWKAKLAELEAVPVDAQLEPVESGVKGVQLWKLTMGNIKGSKIHGYLAKPEGATSCPAMLQVQYAGVYPLNKDQVVGQAKQGWMALDILAHDLPVDESKDFYDKQVAGPLKNYASIGNDNRDTTYFLRMYLSCYRAADYLTKRPDWNSKTLLVQGGSQGGLQTIVTAGLHPAVTAATANVPAGCDHTGFLVGRDAGWPKWLHSSASQDQKAVATAATYYDVVNFARRVKCPVLIGMGLIDTTCPPAGVFAMINQLKVPKRVVIMPASDHMGSHQAYYPVMNGWWTAAKDGKALPMQ